MAAKAQMKNRSKALSLILLMAMAAAVPGSLAKSSFKIGFTQVRLDNGLRVVMSADHSAPVVAVAVYYDVGSRNEVKGRSGLAHLFEHMMFQGSRNVSKGEYFKYIAGAGGEMNASTHADYTNYYAYLPSNQIELVLWLEADRMKSLAVTAKNLANQKDAVKEEKRLQFDNQAYWPALTKMDEMIFANWANAHPPIGDMKDLDNADIADVQRFFATYYAPNNAVLAVVGDIDISRTKAAVTKYFSGIPRKKAPPPVNVSEPPEVAVGRAVIDDALAEIPAVAVAWKIPAQRSPDFYAISLLKSLLCDGDSARLYRALVKDKAISVRVEGHLDERRGPGALTIFTIHKSDVKSDDVEAAIDQEIARIKRDGVAGDELARVKNQYRLLRYTQGAAEQSYGSLQTPLGRALALAEHALFDDDPSLVNTEVDRYMDVTPQQVRDAAVSYFGAKNRSVLYIRPSASKPEKTEDNARKTGS